MGRRETRDGVSRDTGNATQRMRDGRRAGRRTGGGRKACGKRGQTGDAGSAADAGMQVLGFHAALFQRWDRWSCLKSEKEPPSCKQACKCKVWLL